jgi:hypothetical protein
VDRWSHGDRTREQHLRASDNCARSGIDHPAVHHRQRIGARLLCTQAARCPGDGDGDERYPNERWTPSREAPHCAICS